MKLINHDLKIISSVLLISILLMLILIMFIDSNLAQIPNDDEINVIVKFIDSNDNGIENCLVQFYNGSWNDFGYTDTDGLVYKNLLARKYTFRIFYNNASITLKQDIRINTTVIFNTINVSVELKNSRGNGLSEGIIEYHCKGWKQFGITNENGITCNELLAKKYSFRINYQGAKITKKQDLRENTSVIFSTYNVTVKFIDSNGNYIDDGNVLYYLGDWKNFGEINKKGCAYQEILPKKYKFKLNYDNVSTNKKQDVSQNATVIFSTVKVNIFFNDSNSKPINGSLVKYHSGNWNNFGITNNEGKISKELLPRKYTFRIYFHNKFQNKKQDILLDNNVFFSTINVSIKFQNSKNKGIQGATVNYYSGDWKNIGLTDANGSISTELLAVKYSFSIMYDNSTQKIIQDLSDNSIVIFRTKSVNISFVNSNNIYVEGGQVYYHSAYWKIFGISKNNSEITKELMPRKYNFKIVYDNVSYKLRQDIRINSTVIFSLRNVTVNFFKSNGEPIENGNISYHAGYWKYFGKTDITGSTQKDLIPKKYSIKLCYNGGYITKKQNIIEDPIVIFNTTNVTVNLLDSQKNPISGGNISYNSGGWKHFGVTNNNGTSKNDLFEKKYKFRIKYDGSYVSKYQDLRQKSIINFSLINTTIIFKSNDGYPLKNGSVFYYSSGWKYIGKTDKNGTINIDLLPKTYTIKIRYDKKVYRKKQNVKDNNTLFVIASFDLYKKPIAITNGPYYAFINQDILFNASNSYDPDGVIINYTWDFGDGKKEFGKIVIHSYNTSGNFTVFLKIKDNDLIESDNITYSIISIKTTSDSLKTGKSKLNSHIIVYENIQNFEDEEELNNQDNLDAEDIIEEDIILDQEEIINNKPKAIIKLPENIKINEIIVLDASESYDIDSDKLIFRWDFNDDGIWDTEYLSNPKVEHIWFESYNGNIILEVLDGNGALDITSISINIKGILKDNNLKSSQILDSNNKTNISILVVIFFSIIICLIIVKKIMIKKSKES